MNLKIEDDVFGIVNRIKEIDDGYYIEFNMKRNCYEVHNGKQQNSYCLTIPYDVLDSRVIDMVLSTSIKFYDNIVDNIDKNNLDIEEKSHNEFKTRSDYMVREIYDFCSNSSKKFDDNSFQTKWR